MNMTKTSTKLTSVNYFELANQYLDIYKSIALKIQTPDPSLTREDREELYIHSAPIFQQAYEFQKMGFNALTAELKMPVSKLEQAVQEAADAIKRIYKVGKFIEVVTDLVAIGAVLAVPAIKPATVIVIPNLVKELIKDVEALKT